MAKEAETIEAEPELDPTQMGDELIEHSNEITKAEASELRELKRKAAVYDALVDQETTTGELFKEWKEHQTTAAEAKKEYDGAVLELRRLIRAQTEDLPLFDGLGEKSEGDEDNSWREVELSSLDLSAKVLENLDASRMTTIGELADYSASGGRLTQVAGIGPAAAGKIEDALELFWANHPGLGEKSETPLADRFGTISDMGEDATTQDGKVVELLDAGDNEDEPNDLEHVVPGDVARFEMGHDEAGALIFAYGLIEAVNHDERLVVLTERIEGLQGTAWAIARPAKEEESSSV